MATARSTVGGMNGLHAVFIQYACIAARRYCVSAAILADNAQSPNPITVQDVRRAAAFSNLQNALTNFINSDTRTPSGGGSACLCVRILLRPFWSKCILGACAGSRARLEELGRGEGPESHQTVALSSQECNVGPCPKMSSCLTLADGWVSRRELASSR